MRAKIKFFIAIPLAVGGVIRERCSLNNMRAFSTNNPKARED